MACLRLDIEAVGLRKKKIRKEALKKVGLKQGRSLRKVRQQYRE